MNEPATLERVRINHPIEKWKKRHESRLQNETSEEKKKTENGAEKRKKKRKKTARKAIKEEMW